MHRAPRSVCAGPHAVRVVPVMKGYADYADYAAAGAGAISLLLLRIGQMLRCSRRI
jgi:hypothetical protein